MTAAEALQSAAMAALADLEGAGVHDGRPLQASVPHAVVEVGPESDWGHKTGAGRELRLAVVLHDKGERPSRLRRLMGEAEARLAAMAREADGWRIVTLHFLRGRTVRDTPGRWAGVVEFRARMLAIDEP
jgi:hypothetical protein